MNFDSDSFEVQQCLTKILENPAANLEIRTLFPIKNRDDERDILNSVNKAIEKVLEVSVQSAGRPMLIHRLRFCWLTLRKADNSIRKNGRKYISNNPPPFDMKNVFKGILNSNELHECFLSQLCNKLSLDPDGGFVRYYYDLLSSTKSKRLDLALIDSSGIVLAKNLRRLIWWIIRRNKYQYAEEAEQGVQIHFTSLVDDIHKELSKRCDPAELRQLPNLPEEVENQVNDWLTYSCLYGEFSPSNKDDLREIAKCFIKDNDLKHKIKEIIVTPPKGSAAQKKLEEQEKELSRFIEENRKLEEENADFRKQIETLKNEIGRSEKLQNRPGNAEKEFRRLEEEITSLHIQLDKASLRETEPVSQIRDSVDGIVTGGITGIFQEY